jgi:hypothetical protein
MFLSRNLEIDDKNDGTGKCGILSLPIYPNA